MGKPNKIVFVSTYIPRECGIATYTNNLMNAIKQADPSTKIEVIAMNDGKSYEYSEIVKQTIDQNIVDEYKKAAEWINSSKIDVVSIQHEFGIFGGFNGRNILEFLKYVKKKKIITFHTIPIVKSKPFLIRAKRSKSRIKLMRQICAEVDGITVMIEEAKKFLVEKVGCPEDKINVIPHGAPKITISEIKQFQKEKVAIEEIKTSDFVISTFGLISPKKGIEYVIKAMPGILRANPDRNIKYLILGKTHPQKPLDYWKSLVSLTKKMNLEKNVLFYPKYMECNEIYKFLSNTDLYITPYYVREQSSSGTLSYAFACGRCVVSTPYVFAEEIIKRSNVGELVDFKDSESISKVINNLIKNPSLIKKYADNSYEIGKSIEWKKIGEDFLNFFNRDEKK